jgi:hypothetical protein
MEDAMENDEHNVADAELESGLSDDDVLKLAEAAERYARDTREIQVKALLAEVLQILDEFPTFNHSKLGQLVDAGRSSRHEERHHLCTAECSKFEDEHDDDEVVGIDRGPR